MPSNQPEQSFKKHTASDPVFITIGLILLVNVVLALYITIRDWPLHSRSHLWWIVVSVALVMLALRVRGYATRNQDRIIRLEERVRYAALLPPAELARAAGLTMPQIVALRFASDAELPALVDRALAENLAPKQIKQSITTWRPDHQRV